MRNLLLIAIMSILTSISLDAQRDKVMTQVDGLGCPYCAYGLEKKFKKVKGIKNVKIEIEEGIFTFTVPSDLELQVEEVNNRVDLAGYTAKLIEIERAGGKVDKMELSYADVETNKSAEFAVFGICNMCKTRIENAARKTVGVGSAKWDKKTKILKIEYDSEQVNVEQIKEALAAKGHDTEDVKATVASYDNLPACCMYDRDDLKERAH